MLKDKSSSAILGVTDVDRARKFYAETLGLTLAEDGMDDVLVFNTGTSSLVVYRSDEAGTNRANAVVWSCGEEIDAIVDALKEKGVTFEHYPESEGFTREGDVHVSGAMKMVWFKDPDGNILHLNNY